MTPLQPPLPVSAEGGAVLAVPGTAEWLRLARLARMLSWLTLGWLGIEAGVAIGAAVIAGSVALLGFGLDTGIEALASIIVIWRFTGTRLTSATAERRAQQLVAVSFYLLAPYIAAAVFIGLAANTLFGAWWLDGAVALGIAAWAVNEGRRAWAGQSCACASQPGQCC